MDFIFSNNSGFTLGNISFENKPLNTIYVLSFGKSLIVFPFCMVYTIEFKVLDEETITWYYSNEDERDLELAELRELFIFDMEE